MVVRRAKIIKPSHAGGGTIYLVRHFKPRVPEGLCYGQTDIPPEVISPSACAHLLTQLPTLAAVFSSPLQRCTALASHMYPASFVAINSLLKELNFGAWEMSPWDSIERAQLDAWAANPMDFAPPQGESFNTLCQRVRQFVCEALTLEEPAIIITHGGVIKAFLYLFAGMELSQALAYSADFGSITSVELAANSG